MVRMMNKLSLTLAAVLFAAACSQPAGKADAKAAPAKAEAPAAADAATPAAGEEEGGRRWQFSQTEEGTHLAYQDDSGEDMGSGFHCQTGTGTIQIAHWADHAIPGEPGPEPRSESVKLTLISGAVRQGYDATANGEEMYGGAEVYADAKPDDAVLKAFASTGVIQFDAYGETSAYPAAPKADVARLLAGCRKAG